MSSEDLKHVYIIDDDREIRRSTYFLLSTRGYRPRSFAGARDFLDMQRDLEAGCVLLDVRMPEIDGIRMLEMQQGANLHHPIVVMTGHGDIAIAVLAMKLGAVDFIEKPFREEVLLETIERALAKIDEAVEAKRDRGTAEALLGGLSPREVEVLRGLLGGASNKVIAFELGLSMRTVEMHRANMMSHLGVRSLPEALTIALAGGLELSRRPAMK